MKLRVVLLLILAPLVLLAAELTLTDLNRLKNNRDAARLARALTEETHLVGDLVHELQKERGFSAGFISSGGVNFPNELAAQREATDGALADVRRGAQGLAAADEQRFRGIEDQLSALGEWRGQVDDLTATVPQMAGYYTGLITDLMTFAQIDVGGAPDLDRLLSSRALVDEAKERAGLERATGATGLGGGFTPAIHDRFVSLAALQLAFLDQAEAALGGNESLIAALRESDEAVAVQALRQRMAAEGVIEGLTAQEWFATSTAWIDRIRETELILAQDIDETAHRIEASQDAMLRRQALTMGVAMALLIGLSLIICERVVWRIRRITCAVDRFTAGEYDAALPKAGGKDELSQMSRAVAAFKDETLAMRRAAEELKASDEALLNAKHGRVVELVTEGLAALARADLTCRFEEPLDEEYDRIRQDFNASSDRLRSVLASIASTITELDRASAGMSGSALDLAARTNEQVDTLRDTSERVGTLSARVESFGDEIRSASGLAGTARENASRSAGVVREAVQAMDRIEKSSDTIGQIISLIDDIAFQTNLLALNAGVEAARAGDAGKGFAVVASEVRALAQRSSDAAKEIKDLIEKSGGHVKTGVDLVNRAGAALEEISDGIARVDDVLGRAASTSTEQIGALKDLAGAMQRMSELAGQNTQMADQTRSAASDIAGRSARLAGLIRDFALEKSGGEQRRAA
ncbi:methyl-accepting chemotaxis protein [Pseudoroseicyclus sp. H15]